MLDRVRKGDVEGPTIIRNIEIQDHAYRSHHSKSGGQVRSRQKKNIHPKCPLQQRLKGPLVDIIYIPYFGPSGNYVQEQTCNSFSDIRGHIRGRVVDPPTLRPIGNLINSKLAYEPRYNRCNRCGEEKPRGTTEGTFRYS